MSAAGLERAAEGAVARGHTRAATRHGPRRSSLDMLLYGFAGLVCLFLMAPILVVFPLSFSAATYLEFPPPGWSLRWYEAYFGSLSWMSATAVTLQVALGTTLLAVPLGTALAFSLVRGRYPGRSLVSALTAAPIIVPNMVIAVAIYGVFAQLQLVGAWYGMVVGHTIYAIPFVVLVVAPTLRGFDENQELAAMGLGASRLGAIWHVTLPQIRPALVSAGFLAFITSFDELVIALFLAGPTSSCPRRCSRASCSRSTRPLPPSRCCRSCLWRS